MPGCERAMIAAALWSAHETMQSSAAELPPPAPGAGELPASAGAAARSPSRESRVSLFASLLALPGPYAWGGGPPRADAGPGASASASASMCDSAVANRSPLVSMDSPAAHGVRLSTTNDLNRTASSFHC